MTDTTTPPKGVHFDATINLGHILTMGSVLVTLIGGAAALHYRMGAVEVQMSGVQKQLAELGVVVIEQAKVGERLIDHGRRIDRLESWKEGLVGAPKSTPWSPP